MIKASAYLVLRPTHRYDGRLVSVEVSRMTKTKPGLKSTEVAIELAITLDEHLFEQYIPAVEIDLGQARQLLTPTVTIPDQVDLEPGEGEP